MAPRVDRSDLVIVTPEVLREFQPPDLGGSAHKGVRGCVLVVAGTSETPGAALLAGIAALRAGAGILQIATAASVARHLAVAVPEARVIALDETAHGDIAASAASEVRALAEHADAVLIGPGLGDDEALAEIVEALLSRSMNIPIVVDAHALTAMNPSDLGSHRDTTVLTPNTKEAATLLHCSAEEVEREPALALEKLVTRSMCTVALRGGHSFVSQPNAPTYRDDSGTPGLASSGSGDVLCGFLAGLLARGASPVAAALWAVHVHARAGQRLGARLGQLGYLARELLDELTSVTTELRM